jgi:hypothetical protein
MAAVAPVQVTAAAAAAVVEGCLSVLETKSHCSLLQKKAVEIYTVTVVTVTVVTVTAVTVAAGNTRIWTKATQTCCSDSSAVSLLGLAAKSFDTHIY